MMVTSPEDFDYLQIGLASPDKIRFWSYGEVEKPETINYRTFKPERKGLFCEKIFGPVKDWECACGKYRRIRYRGIICERCGVEVTHSKVRRERMGHIELAAPVSHIWFLKGIPGYLGLILDLTTRQLEEVIYYDAYITTEVANDEIKKEVGELLSIDEYYDLKEQYGSGITAKMGAAAIRELLESIDLEKMVLRLREEMAESKGQKRIKLTKRLKLLEAMKKSGNRPENLILDVIPVMPPDLRPMVQLEGGRFATSDLNDLYRRVVNRNNRLKRLIDIGAPDMIIRNEKRMLQESVDVLISNGKRGRAVTGNNGRPLKSLGNIIEGKQGRFRQNLLGKRVDYSGRSVIVVGPHLKFNQCGLPKEMALELFKPFIIRELVSEGLVSNVKSAKRKIERRDDQVWDVLDKVIKGQPVLLNRAPTLHRLGIQAFDPILVEGAAIQVHPLVCTAFNADFDGDQMAVHVPLSLEAQAECRLLILSTNNVLSPTNGRSVITPTQDMVLGCYYLTVEDDSVTLGKGTNFKDVDEVFRAWDAKCVDYHSKITVRIDGQRIETTVGRVIFNQPLRELFAEYNITGEPFINQVVGKKQLGDFIYQWYIKHGNDIATRLADALKEIGFHYATLSGISISLSDLQVPEAKHKILEDSEKEVLKIKKMEQGNQVSSEEATFMTNDIWRNATMSISDSMEAQFGSLNNVFIMANSGARGNIDQVKQLAGMRGLMSDAQGRTIAVPIKSNFKEGLSLAEYFISCYGARKGLVDTALRTADSGYLTRRLVDVAQNVTISEEDCGTKKGVQISAISSGVDVFVPLSDMVEGRISLEQVKDSDGKVVVKKGQLISREQAKEIEATGIESLHCRAIFSCDAKRGVCQSCYGTDLSTGRLVNLGEAVGIIAAQSIGEPGTQLTMRTFHTGGVDLRKASLVTKKSTADGTITLSEGLELSTIIDEDGQTQWVSVSEGHALITNDNGKSQKLVVPVGATLLVKPKQKVKSGDGIFAYDPMFNYVLAGEEGEVQCDWKATKGSKSKTTVLSEVNTLRVVNTKRKAEILLTEREADKLKKGDFVDPSVLMQKAPDFKATGIVADIKKNEAATKKSEAAKVTIHSAQLYFLEKGTTVFVANGDKVAQNDVIAFKRFAAAQGDTTKDIVQGLPRVEELFEARRYSDNGVLAAMDGVVSVGNSGTNKVLSILGEDGKVVEEKLPANTVLAVYSGQKVSLGDQLTAGIVNPHDILETQGVLKAQEYLVNEVQSVYRSQGVSIHSKHVELIIRQMTKRVVISDMGDSEFLLNEVVEIRDFELENEKLVKAGKSPAKATRVLLGITRASLSTDSFISASSFQETAKVLSKAAIYGEKDPMYGLKENVIIGKLIPAGTGFKQYPYQLESKGGDPIEFSEEERVFNERAEAAAAGA